MYLEVVTKSFSSHAVFLLSMCAAACGSPAVVSRAERAAPSPRDERPAPAPPACRIEAVRGAALTVAIDGGEPFDVDISDGSLSFAPAQESSVLVADVDHPLRFRA